MKDVGLLFFAFIGGISLAIQGGLNARLGILLKNPLWASVTAFAVSTVVALLIVVVIFRSYPTSNQIKEIPTYLWFTGGIFSVLGLGLYYFTIPKIGISATISLGLCGQLIFAIIAGHFGWLGLPIEPLTLKKVLGAVAMICGILLVNLK